ncbi:MAG: D-glycero-beta-D-manno-heptose 1-phosphate adenylyltransferase [bacterium]|nr:D-glycero-beta-D-manno-heptose 1-phosphate adenylyltransferase [bacterium]
MSRLKEVERKIFTWESLPKQLLRWASEQKKIVFTNGCFDLLHRGHVDYLAKAADLGDVLVVGLNTDSSVSKLKGEHRPIQDENSRLQIIASLGFVDAVILFDEPTPLALIQLVRPDVLVKGSDYQPKDIVGYETVMLKGGEVKTIDFIPGYSTSGIEKKIKLS